MNNLISIIAPMFNEEKLVEAYCEETIKTLSAINSKYDLEIILVNDGSNDNTYAEMEKIREKYAEIITIVNLSRNFGLEGAISAGMKKAAGDAVVVMDADLQDPPALIPLMVEKWENGAEIVIARRSKRMNDNFFKRISASVYYKILGSLSGKLKLEENAANFRLLSRNAVDKIMALPEVNTVFRVTVPYIGLKTDTVEYERDRRYAGKTKYNLFSMVRYALDSITGISVEPLRKITAAVYFSAVMVLASIIGIFTAADSNWRICFLLITCMSVFFAVMFGCIALVGEYIGQIMIEVKGRPTSIISNYIPSGNAKNRR